MNGMEYKVDSTVVERREDRRPKVGTMNFVRRASFRMSRWMSEGRKSQIVLLDERHLDILVQPKLETCDLLDMVSSHFNLKEKDYFGLAFLDETSHFQWLALDRKVLENDFPRKSGPLTLYFAVRFYIPSICGLAYNSTIELFYLQAKQNVFKGVVECDSDTAFELAAHVLQASIGDYTDDQAAKLDLKKLPILPTSALHEHPSIQFCEDQVIAQYKKLAGLSRGLSIVNYMNIVESLPTYGIHYYEVKDKNSIPWWLGLSHRGIAQYDHNDKKTPRRVFAWKHLENLYFRDKKFSIEVHDPKRIVHTISSFNLYEDAIQEPIEEFDDLCDAISDPTTQVSVSRRTFGPGNVNVYAWFASTPNLTKCIWQMAVDQHKYYLDRKQSKANLPSVRSMSEIAADLSISTTSLAASSASGDNLSRNGSSTSLPKISSSSLLELSIEESETTKAAQRDMYAALKARKEALEEALRKKTEELKLLCIKEGEITGKLPKETPLNPEDPVPVIRRRIGTAFTLSPKYINSDKNTNKEEDALNSMELHFEIQAKITSAAHRLAQEPAVKSMRKKRKQTYQKSHMKLKELEKKLNALRLQHGKDQITIQSSVEDLSASEDSMIDSETEYASPVPSPLVRRQVKDAQKVKVVTSPQVEVVEIQQQRQMQDNQRRGDDIDIPRREDISRQREDISRQREEISRQREDISRQREDTHRHREERHMTPPSQHPSSGNMQSHRQDSRGSTPSPVPGRHYTGQGQAYVPNSVYTTRTSYRSQMYPTFSQRSQSNSSNMSEYDNIRSPSQEQAPGHVYHINTARTGRYDSADELKTPTPMTPDPYGSGLDVFSESEVSNRDKRRHQQRTASLDRAYRRTNDSSSSVSDVDRYGSLDRRGDIVMLAELTPSRFGCKRDSHAEPGDEPSQSQLSPITRHFSDSSDYSDPRTPTNIPQDDRPRSPRYTGPLPGQISSGYYPSGPNWYDNKGQHVSSSRDSSESGDYSYKPRFIADTPTPPMVKHLPAYGYDSKEPSNIPAAPPRGTSSQHHSIAVKNYGLETSKPFEMADVYKYSEKFRRQRSSDQYDSEGGSSPNLSRHMPPSPQVVRGRRSRSPSPYRQSPHQESPGSPYQVRRPIPADNYGSSSRPQYSTPQSVHSPHGNSAYNSPQNPQSTYSTPHGSQSNHQGAYQHPQSKESGKSNGPYNNRSANESPLNRPADSSGSFTYDAGESLAEAFSEEMLAWYEDQQESVAKTQESATLV